MTRIRFNQILALATTDIAVLARLWQRLSYDYSSGDLIGDLGPRRAIRELAELAYDLTV